MRKTILFFILVASMLASCSGDKVKYRIGVSQCSDDIWRDKQNAELRMGAYFHDNVELKFAVAYDSDERQVQQIDSIKNNPRITRKDIKDMLGVGHTTIQNDLRILKEQYGVHYEGSSKTGEWVIGK